MINDIFGKKYKSNAQGSDAVVMITVPNYFFAEILIMTFAFCNDLKGFCGKEKSAKFITLGRNCFDSMKSSNQFKRCLTGIKLFETKFYSLDYNPHTKLLADLNI